MDNASLFIAYLSSSSGEFLLDLKQAGVIPKDEFLVHLSKGTEILEEL